MDKPASEGNTGAAIDRNGGLPSDDDAQIQALVLGLVLIEHPRQLTFTETVRALVHDDDASDHELDALSRAVRDLSAYGLLHRNGEHLAPSRAALHFDGLPFP